MIEKPVWIDYILTSTQAYNSFMAYCDEQRRLKVEEILGMLKAGKVSEADALAGHVDFIDTMRNTLEMYRKEEQDYAAIQEQRRENG